MLDHLLNFVSHLGAWAYAIIFLAVFLESAAFLGFVVPGETLVLLGGFLAAEGSLHLPTLIAIVCIGAILGDSVGFEVGRHLGRDWLLRHGRRIGLNAQRLEYVERFFCNHGGKAVLIGRFSAFLRALTPFVAGASKMRYGRFLLYNALGGIIWSITFLALGYLFGASWRLIEHIAGRAGAIAAGVMLLLLAWAWLWRWLLKHEQTVRRWGRRFRDHPRIAALRRRFAPQLAFLAARLSPGGYLGLHLTLGTLILIGALWLFGGIAEDVVHGDPLTRVDRQVNFWLHAHAAPPVTHVMLAITTIGGPWVIAAFTLLLATVLLLRRRWYWLLSLLLVVPGGALLNILLKWIFHRPRPLVPPPLLQINSYSFPSGHANLALLFYGLLAILIVRSLSGWRWRVAVTLIAILIILLIGFSRMYLGVHYLSDVLAAWAEGAAWIAICLTAVKTAWETAEARAAATPPP